MTEVTLDGRGRLALPKNVRERHGDWYRYVRLHNGIKLVSVADDPLKAPRAGFADVETAVEDLHADARGRHAARPDDRR